MNTSLTDANPGDTDLLGKREQNVLQSGKGSAGNGVNGPPVGRKGGRKATRKK